MLRKLSLLLFFMFLGMTFAWKAMDSRDANGQFKQQNFLTHTMTFIQTFYTNIQKPEVQARLKETKVNFKGKEIPLYFTGESLKKFIKTDAKAQRALFVFGLFLFNLWLLPLLTSLRQRKLKDKLFNSNPDLMDTQIESSRFFSRLFYTSNLGSFVLICSYFYLAAAIMMVVGFIGYAWVSYEVRTQKYQSVARFKQASQQGSFIKQMVAYFTTPPPKTVLVKPPIRKAS